MLFLYPLAAVIAASIGISPLTSITPSAPDSDTTERSLLTSPAGSLTIMGILFDVACLINSITKAKSAGRFISNLRLISVAVRSIIAIFAESRFPGAFPFSVHSA